MDTYIFFQILLIEELRIEILEQTEEQLISKLQLTHSHGKKWFKEIAAETNLIFE